MAEKSKILLVDDDAEFLEEQGKLLEAKGFQVTKALGSHEGLEWVRSEIPDCIIVDMAMESHDDGILFAQKVKKYPLLAKVPVILLAVTDESHPLPFTMEEDGYWLKVDEIENKPVDTASLAKKIEKLIK